MRNVLATLILTACSSMSASAQSGIEDVAWLQGCWIMQFGERVVEEQWMAPRGDAMVGMSRTVSGGRLRGVELVVIHTDSTGLVYRADPSGQDAAIFRATSVGARRVVFENPEHDFPQTIGYELVGTDSLHAWIAGTAGGQERRIPFPYARARCAGVPGPESEVESFLATVVEDLALKGPLAWLDHMDDGAGFFMASDGVRVFPDFSTADEHVRSLAETYTRIVLHLDGLDVHPVTSDYALFGSPYRETIHRADGDSLAFGGFVTGSVGRRDGRWLIRHLHWSSPVMGTDPD